MVEHYDRLRAALADRPLAVEKLDRSQQAWHAFSAAQLTARYPHQDEQGYYGSVLPMCLAGELQWHHESRAEQLAQPPQCGSGGVSAADALARAQRADVALNEVYRQVRAHRAGDPVFLSAFKQAQRAWLALRDAQVELVAAACPGDPAAAPLELERVVNDRTKVMKWSLEPASEDDVCRGS